MRPLAVWPQRSAVAVRAWGSALVCGLAVLLCASCARHGPLVVRVDGNRLADAQGDSIRLLGVNRSGSEYACTHALGFFAGPTDRRAIAAMVAWHINAVRLPLNEDCWLGINGMPAHYSGAPYREAVSRYVARLHRANLYVVLDLHWNAPGPAPATSQQPMADFDHAPAFWSSVARQFKRDPAIMFDLYNEPHDISWQCWRDGCLGPEGWRTAGMQALLTAVRSTGARQPIIAAGLGAASDLSMWMQYRPHDPARQLVAGFHAYNRVGCDTLACWRAQLGLVTRAVPVIATEVGEGDCSRAFVDQFMNWADSRGVSYLGWSWNPAGCGAPALISSWGGQPTPYGQGLRSHLRSSGDT